MNLLEAQFKFLWASSGSSAEAVLYGLDADVHLPPQPLAGTNLFESLPRGAAEEASWSFEAKAARLSQAKRRVLELP
jgi:hypothetical protein